MAYLSNYNYWENEIINKDFAMNIFKPFVPNHLQEEGSKV